MLNILLLVQYIFLHISLVLLLSKSLLLWYILLLHQRLLLLQVLLSWKGLSSLNILWYRFNYEMFLFSCNHFLLHWLWINRLLKSHCSYAFLFNRYGFSHIYLLNCWNFTRWNVLSFNENRSNHLFISHDTEPVSDSTWLTKRLNSKKTNSQFVIWEEVLIHNLELNLIIWVCN